MPAEVRYTLFYERPGRSGRPTSDEARVTMLDDEPFVLEAVFVTDGGEYFILSGEDMGMAWRLARVAASKFQAGDADEALHQVTRRASCAYRLRRSFPDAEASLETAVHQLAREYGLTAYRPRHPAAASGDNPSTSAAPSVRPVAAPSVRPVAAPAPASASASADH